MKRVAAILFNFVDDPQQPITPAEVRRQLFTGSDSTNAFYNEVSFGQLGITGSLRPDGDVFGWYTLPLTGPYPTSTPDRVADINRIAQADGFIPGNYDAILYTDPWRPGGFAGQAFGATNQIELNGFNNWVAAHEIFHQLGIDHANGLRCTQAGARVSINDDYESIPYGDPFDIQGGSFAFAHPNIYFKARMGWLQTNNFVTVRRDRNRTDTFDINPIERASNGLLGVRIPIPADRIALQFGWGDDPTTVKLYYYLEYRRPSTFDRVLPADAVANGVSIHVNTDIDTNHMSLLVDTSPETDGFNDAPLTVGKVFKDSVAGVTIRTLSVSPSLARVQISTEAGDTRSQGPHMLWSRADGTASLWTLDDGENYVRHRYYGPIPNMTAVSYQRVDPMVAKLLWARSDGLAIIWNLDEKDNVVSIKRHGPFPNWTARSYQKLANGTARLLWSRTDGMGIIWTLNNADDFVAAKNMGPYSQWTARSYQRLNDGTARLLWSRGDGLASLFTLNSADDYVSHIQHGPSVGWTATDYQKLSDGSGRMILKGPDGSGGIGTLNAADTYSSFRYYGPFSNWSAEGYSER